MQWALPVIPSFLRSFLCSTHGNNKKLQQANAPVLHPARKGKQHKILFVAESIAWFGLYLQKQYYNCSWYLNTCYEKWDGRHKSWVLLWVNHLPVACTCAAKPRSCPVEPPISPMQTCWMCCLHPIKYRKPLFTVSLVLYWWRLLSLKTHNAASEPVCTPLPKWPIWNAHAELQG